MNVLKMNKEAQAVRILDPSDNVSFIIGVYQIKFERLVR